MFDKPSVCIVRPLRRELHKSTLQEKALWVKKRPDSDLGVNNCLVAVFRSKHRWINVSDGNAV